MDFNCFVTLLNLHLYTSLLVLPQQTFSALPPTHDNNNNNNNNNKSGQGFDDGDEFR